MMVLPSYYILIAICVLLNTVSQILLKTGLNQIGHFAFSISDAASIGWKFITSWHIMAGLICYGFSFVCWLLALSRMEVSVAYPMASIGYVMTAIAGYFILNESLSVMKISGIVVIMIGVYLVSQH